MSRTAMSPTAMSRTAAVPGNRRSHLYPAATWIVLLWVAAVGCDTALGGSHQQVPPTVTPEVEEVYRIGSVDGGSWESFSVLVAAGFDARGHLYLLDGHDPRLTVVDPRGELVQMVGRAGDGPGEFRRPLAMAVLPDGHVVVSDAGHRGLLVFDPTGAFARSVPLGEGEGAPSILLPHGDAEVVYAATPIMMMGGPGAGARDVSREARIVRARIDGSGDAAVLDRAWLPPRAQPRVDQEGGMTRMTRPMRAFEPELHVAVLRSGHVSIVDSTSYRIRMLPPDGGSPQAVERAVEPRAVGPREQEREKERRLRELAQGRTPAGPATVMGRGGAPAGPDPSQMRSILEAQLEDLLFWPEIQVIQALKADGAGRLWVQRFGDVDEPGPIEVLDPNGRLRAIIPAGALELPAAFGPDGMAAWIELDELDVPFVRVGRLQGLP